VQSRDISEIRLRHPVDAREPLRQGLELARACQGVTLAERAHEELVAAGARLHGASDPGLESIFVVVP
jgi:hypothetical protein